jgi:uncharacterized protein (DUF1330 family)
MSAYLIVIREETLDPAELKEYRAQAQATFAGHPVKFLAAYGALHMLEGPSVEAAVVLRFDAVSDALAWYESPAYQKALQHRLKGSRSRACFFYGLEA